MQIADKNNIPDFQTIMLPLLKLLEDSKPKSLNEVMDSLTKHFQLNPQELKIKVPSGQMGLFRNRVGWSRSYLKKAGLIFYPERGTYQITDFGKNFWLVILRSCALNNLKKCLSIKSGQKPLVKVMIPLKKRILTQIPSLILQKKY